MPVYVYNTNQSNHSTIKELRMLPEDNPSTPVNSETVPPTPSGSPSIEPVNLDNPMQPSDYQPIQAVDTPVSNNAPEKPKSKSFKRVVVVVVIIAIIGVAGVVAWGTYFSNLVMKQYSSNDFEVSLPASYITKEVNPICSIFAKIRLFGKNDGRDTNAYVCASIISESTKSKTRAEKEAEYAALFTEENKANVINNFATNSFYRPGSLHSDDVSIRNFKKDGVSIYSANGRYNIGETSGYFSGAKFVGDEKYAEVYVVSQDGSDILQDASRIIDTFKLQ